MYQMPQNCTLKHAHKGTFYVMYILPQLKKPKKTGSSKHKHAMEIQRGKDKKSDCLWGAGFGEKEKRRKLLFLIINPVRTI